MGILGKKAAERYNARRGRRAAARAARAEPGAEAEAEAKPGQPKAIARFTQLGVQIMDNGDVHTYNGFGGHGRRLGRVQGAHARLASHRTRRQGSALALPAALAGSGRLPGAARKKPKATAFVFVTGGEMRKKTLSGATAITKGHREVLSFNAAAIRYGKELNLP